MTTTKPLEAHDYTTALSTLPELYATEDLPLADRRAVYLDAGAVWFLVEYDPIDRIAFGLCDLGVGFPEVGYVSIDEITSVRGALGLPVELDLFGTFTLADGYRYVGKPVPE